MPDITDLELSAFDVLDKATDFNQGIKDLQETYTAAKIDDPKAKEILADYGDQLAYKFKQKGMDTSTLLKAAPISPDQVAGETDIEKINNWEQANTMALDSSDDLDYLVHKNQLKKQIITFASESRRDITGNRGKGVFPYVADKFFRTAEGAVGGVARLFGDEEIGRDLRELTDRNRDQDLSSHIASGAGALVPMTVGGVAGFAVAGPAGATVGAAAGAGVDITGHTRAAYEDFKSETGDETKAGGGAALVAGAGIIGFVPYGRILGKATGKLATNLLGTSAVGKIIIGAGEGALGQGASQVVANIGEAVGNDTTIDLKKDVFDAAIVGGILTGGFSGVHALAERAYETRTQKLLESVNKEAADSTQPPPSAPGKEVSSPHMITSEELAPFERGSDGHLSPVKITTVEERVKQTEKAKQLANDYIYEKTPDESPNKFYDEAGEEVQPDVGEDSTTDSETFLNQESEGGKRIVLSDANQHPNGRFATWLAGKLGSTTTLKHSIMDGAFGVARSQYDPATGNLKNFQVEVLRSLAADPEHFTKTMAHEVGHILDYATNPETFLNPSLRDLGVKLTGIKQALMMNHDVPELRAEATKLSQIWRPGWDGKTDTRFGKYRAEPAEIYADNMSAIINAPTWVKENFPKTWDAFEKRLGNSPELNEAWSKIQSFETDPSAISQFNMQIRHEARAEQLTRTAAGQEKRAAKRAIGVQLREAGDQLYKFTFDKLTDARRVVNTLPPKAKKYGFEILNNLERKDYNGEYYKREIDTPLKDMMYKLKSEKIELNDFAHHLWSDRVLNETTATIERVLQDPATYTKALVRIKGELANHPGVNHGLIAQELDLARAKTPEDLVKTLARIGIVTDASRAPTIAELVQKYPVGDPDRMTKARNDYSRIKNQQNKGLPSESRVALKEWANGLKKTDPDFVAITDVMSDNAFNVRRFLANAGATSEFDARRDIQHIKDKLNAKQYKTLQEQADLFHKTMMKATKVLDRAGLLTPELKERIDLNASNYVTANVLKYFEDASSIDSSIRAAVGSLSETGNELASTVLKAKAFIDRGYHQQAANSLVQLGRISEFATSPEKTPFGKSIFDHRKQLSRENPDSSYILEYKDGKPEIYKIAGDNKAFEKILEKQDSLPVVSALGNVVSNISKALATRQLFTNLSPRFVLNQKFMDRFNESLRARSPYAILNYFLPVAVDPKLRAMDKTSIAAIKLYEKTGKLSGPLEAVANRDAALLQLSTWAMDGKDTEHTFESMLFKEFGVEPPEVDHWFDKSGKVVEKIVRTLPWTKAVEHTAEFDELRTKLNGYQIGKSLGMTDAEAAIFTREKFGNPDPLGGGSGAAEINKWFLFGRAQFNGLRALASVLTDNKSSKTSWSTAALVGVMKASTSAVLMGAALRQVFGDEEADKYEDFLKRIPSADKISRNVIPIGYQDSAGNMHNYFDVKKEDIQADWKSMYARIPQSREITTVSRILAPMFGIVDNPQAVAGNVLKASENELLANMQPTVQYLANLWAIAKGENPIDSFRNKPILSKDAYQAGGLDVAKEYGVYALGKQFSGFAAYNPFATETKASPQGDIEVAGKTPIVGPMVKNLVGVSNYGLFESDKVNENLKDQFDAKIRLSTKKDTQFMIEQNKFFNAQTAGKTREERALLGPGAMQRGAILKSWEAKIWQPFRNELRAAKERGDQETYDGYLDTLETQSQAYKKMLTGDSPDK